MYWWFLVLLDGTRIPRWCACLGICGAVVQLPFALYNDDGGFWLVEVMPMMMLVEVKEVMVFFIVMNSSI